VIRTRIGLEFTLLRAHHSMNHA